MSYVCLYKYFVFNVVLFDNILFVDVSVVGPVHCSVTVVK